MGDLRGARRWRWWWGCSAILKAGGAYVPLDPGYPAERLAYMLADSAPVVVLTQAACASGWRACPGGVPVLELDTQAAQWQGSRTTNPAADAAGLTPQHLAYVIYTSGSTGQPKGVMVEHANVGAAVLRPRPQCVRLRRARRVDAVSLGRVRLLGVGDVGRAAARRPAGGGARRAVRARRRRSATLLCEHGVTVLNQTPAAFRQLMAAQQGRPAAHCAALRGVRRRGAGAGDAGAVVRAGAATRARGW